MINCLTYVKIYYIIINNKRKSRKELLIVYVLSKNINYVHKIIFCPNKTKGRKRQNQRMQQHRISLSFSAFPLSLACSRSFLH